MIIEVCGPGCPRCQATEKNVLQALKELGMELGDDAMVIEIKDIKQISARGVIMTPAVVIDGVFIVGIIGALLPQEWIETWLGGAGLRQSFLATLIGAVTYFATMTEAPFVDTLMNLGMGKGPALALLLTGPGISLPNWLAIARVFGVKKAL
ncbi:unnamed protein product, partial [marine sediment metagenome]